jgi:hypothetical protein
VTLESDALEDVRDSLACVDGGLERLEDVLPADDDHRIDAVHEQRRNGLADDPVGLVLELVDLSEVRLGVDVVAEAVQGQLDLAGGADENAGQRLRRFHRRLDGVAAQLVSGLLRVVDDVVQRASQRVHIRRIEA